MGETIQLLLPSLWVSTYTQHSRPYQNSGVGLFYSNHHCCRCRRFAEEMAGLVVMQMEKDQAIIDTFSIEVCNMNVPMGSLAMENRGSGRTDAFV